jgi:hypothetical protein
LLSFRRKPESSIYERLQTIWAPAFAGATTFYELVKDDVCPLNERLDLSQVRPLHWDLRIRTSKARILRNLPAFWSAGLFSIGQIKLGSYRDDVCHPYIPVGIHDFALRPYERIR